MAAPENNPFIWFTQLPKLGPDEDFAALWRLLEEAGYDEKNVLQRTDCDNVEQFCHPPEGGRKLNDPLDGLITLFYDCGFVEESALGNVLPPGSIALLDRLGLLVREHAPQGMVYTSAAILPTSGCLTICDRGAAPDGSRTPYPGDVVYPAVFETTKRFLAMLPDTPADNVLDLGSGTGIGAMLAARTAQRAWATDITDRAVLFAEFNRRLAGLDNLTVVKGDLFEPVTGLQFNRITIHPPYVPANVRRSDHVFAVSGDDGEWIIRRTVEGLPQFLRPGGRFYSLQVATDRENELFEERVRKWLGEAHEEFDIALAIHSRRSPMEYLAADETRLGQERENWMNLWERTRTQYMVYGTLLIERHAEPRKALSMRAHEGIGYTARDLEWLLEWQQSLTRPNHVEMLLGCRPLARPENELVVTERLRDGAFRRVKLRMDIPGPFKLALNCEQWLPLLIPSCDGITTWRQHFHNAKRDNIIREDLEIEEFAKGLGVLVSLGALKIPD